MTYPAKSTDSRLLIPGFQQTFYPNGSVGPVIPATAGYASWIRESHPASQKGVVDEWGWRQPTPWLHTWFRCNPNDAGFQANVFWSNGQRTYYSGLASGNNDLGTVPPFLPTLVGKAVNKCLTKLKGDGANLLTNFWERKQTVDLFTHVGGTLSGGFKSVLKRTGTKWLKEAVLQRNRGSRFSGYPDLFLEFLYGAKPLLGDLQGAVERRHQEIRGRSPVVSVKATVGAKSATSWIRKSSAQGGLKWFCPVNGTSFNGCKVRLDFCLDNPFLASLSALGITNIENLVWEELPYSFVADWFVNVGEWLSLMDATYGYSFRSGSASEFSWLRGSGTWGPSEPTPSWTAQVISGKYRVDAGQFRRTVYTTSPLPWIGLKNPFPKNGIHIAEAIALVKGSFRI